MCDLNPIDAIGETLIWTLTARIRGRLNTHKTSVQGSASKTVASALQLTVCDSDNNVCYSRSSLFFKWLRQPATAKARSMVPITDRTYTLFMALCSDYADSKEVE